MKPARLLLGEAWGIYKERFDIFVGIYAVPFVTVLIFGIIGGFVSVGVDEALFELLALIAAPLVFISLLIINVLTTIATLKTASGESVGFKDAYAFAWSKFTSYFWVMLLTGLAVLGGFILLIIPGIIFAVWFMFSHLTVLFEDKRGVEALKHSKAYVRGRWWEILGKMAYFVLISFGIIILFLIVAFVATFALGTFAGEFVMMISNFLVFPLSLSYTYCVYRNVRGLGEVGAEGSATGSGDGETAINTPAVTPNEVPTETPVTRS